MFSIFSGNANSEEVTPQDMYSFEFKSLMEEAPLPLSQFKGRVILIVNTASKCGFTPQYAGLETIYKKYKDQGLTVIGVPSDDFGGQEPGTGEVIEQFCRLNYGVSFPMTAKEKITGENEHPFYRAAHKILGFGTAPKWNFHKYLINRQGKLIDYFHSTTAPDSPRLLTAVENALKAE